MKRQIKKIIAPIIITILIVSYFTFYILIGIFIKEMPLIIKILLVVFPMALIVLAIYMLFERIKEIKGGEEDDLSKY